MTSERMASWLMALVLLGCATGAGPSRPVPSGPALSYLYAPRAFFLRVDCAAIRGAPVAADVLALWRSSPLVERLGSTASFDPIADLAGGGRRLDGDGPIRRSSRPRCAYSRA